MANDALALHEIDAFYADSHVLHRVSLRLGEGRLLGLLGRNGAGKSTSMNVTVGLLPPRHGAVTVFGSVVTGRTPEAIAAQGVALVPQGRRVFRSLTVRENLAVAGRKPRGRLPMLWTFETVFALFPTLRERHQQIAGSLSGGEQQMLAIARGLVARPRIMLVDEPTEGLAPLLVQSLTEILREINRRGTTILLVEQTLEVAMALSHRLYVMDQGRIQFEGTPDALRKDPTIQQRFLQV